MGFYAIAPSPVDGTLWGTVTGYPGSVVRVDPGSNPPATALAEIYEVPLPGFSPRGGDIDGQGVMWAALASGHLGAFDRRKCKGPLNGPTATGKHCPEGWTLYPLPGPQLGGIDDNGSGETPYYAWVDQHDTLGLGKDVPIATGNQNDSLIALKDGHMINLVVPYPSMIPMPDGKGVACGRIRGTGRRSTSKAARATRPRSCTSRCAPIRSRGEEGSGICIKPSVSRAQRSAADMLAVEHRIKAAVCCRRGTATVLVFGGPGPAVHHSRAQ